MGFAAWLATLPVPRRAMLSLGLTFGSIVFLVLGRILTFGGGWAAWALRAIVLEPVGIVGILGAYAAAEPRSRFSLDVSRALAQRRYGAAAAVLLSLGLILELVRWVARQAMLAPPR